MTEYIGLDVSMKETAVSIRREGERIWRGKCASDPNIIAELVRKRAPARETRGVRNRPSVGVVLSFSAPPRGCQQSASMLAMPKLRLIWRRTRRTRTTLTVWRILLK